MRGVPSVSKMASSKVSVGCISTSIPVPLAGLYNPVGVCASMVFWISVPFAVAPVVAAASTTYTPVICKAEF